MNDVNKNATSSEWLSKMCWNLLIFFCKRFYCCQFFFLKTKQIDLAEMPKLFVVSLVKQTMHATTAVQPFIWWCQQKNVSTNNFLQQMSIWLIQVSQLLRIEISGNFMFSFSLKRIEKKVYQNRFRSNENANFSRKNIRIKMMIWLFS